MWVPNESVHRLLHHKHQHEWKGWSYVASYAAVKFDFLAASLQLKTCVNDVNESNIPVFHVHLILFTLFSKNKYSLEI